MSNTKQTPLQRLIAEKEQRLKSLQNTVYPSVKVKVQINCIKHDIERMKKELPYEREVIDNAYNQGTIDGENKYHIDSRYYENSAEYFNQTFQTNE